MTSTSANNMTSLHYAVRPEGNKRVVTDWVCLGNMPAVPMPELVGLDKAQLQIQLSTNGRLLKAVREAIGVTPATISPAVSGFNRYDVATGKGQLYLTFNHCPEVDTFLTKAVNEYQATEGKAMRIRDIARYFWPSTRSDVMPDAVAEVLYDTCKAVVSGYIKHADSIQARQSEVEGLQSIIASRKAQGKDTKVFEEELKAITSAGLDTFDVQGALVKAINPMTNRQAGRRKAGKAPADAVK